MLGLEMWDQTGATKATGKRYYISRDAMRRQSSTFSPFPVARKLAACTEYRLHRVWLCMGTGPALTLPDSLEFLRQ